METLVKIAWLSLALVHGLPALVLFAPSMVERLYAVSPSGDVGVLIVHRGALFLAMIVAALFALADPAVRRAASAIVAVSIIGFLLVYVRAGMPSGALRTIALADVAALLPLALVSWHAWASGARPG